MTDYIVASRVDWHYREFEKLKEESDGRWHWVSSPEELDARLEVVKPRYIFFLHWSWKVPASVYEAIECVCFHMTDVPYGRGGSPLQNLIIRGHKSTKLSALRMVESMDAGPVYLKRELLLSGAAQNIYERAGRQSIEMLKIIKEQELVPIPQQGEVIEFERRKPSQSELPVQSACSLNVLYDFIRMLDAEGYPASFLITGNFRIEFKDATLEGDTLSTTATITKRSEHGN